MSAEEAEELSVGDAEFHVRAEKLDRKELFGNPDPFLKIYRILDDNGYVASCSIHIASL